MASWAFKRYGSGWTGPKKAPRKLVREEVDVWNSPEDFSKVLLEIAEDLTDSYVELDDEYSYGHPTPKFYVVGWRLATKAEIEEAEREFVNRERRSKQYLDSAERALRANRPELFK
jgi:hypothetical protein